MKGTRYGGALRTPWSCQATPAGVCVTQEHLESPGANVTSFPTPPSPGLKLTSGSIIQLTAMSNSATSAHGPFFCSRRAMSHSSDDADLAPDDADLASNDADLASDERSSSDAETSFPDEATESRRSQHYHRRPVMQRDQSLFIVSQRRRIWQKRQTNPTNSNVRRAHRRNRATLSAIIRELERLLIELKRKPMSDPWPLLDHLDALIAPTKQLSKRIKRGQNKALTTAFCERLPQVMV